MPRARISDRIELEYDVTGGGTPLLLIGGLGAQLISWDDRFCDLLAARGYQVIRFDNRDAGLSTSLDECGVPDLLGLLLEVGSAPYLLDEMADDSLGLLDHLEVERAHLLGLSLGGMIGQLLALRHPERVLSVVAALSGPPGRPAHLPASEVVEALLRRPSIDFEDRVTDAVKLRRALAGDGSGFDAQDARRRAAAQIARSYRPAGTMRQAAAVLGTPNRLQDLGHIELPTMIVHGELDPLVPFASARAAAEAIANSTFVGIAGLGHDLPAGVALDLIERISEFHSPLALSR
ncbi:MAG TPA: alpha/beta hydrolase [Candidatus Dormibacteraeota bacterium]|nr:alpha/beta hydrolase [Candidatus Dormibacteraeota bacterium]